MNKLFSKLQTLGPSLTTGIAIIPLGGLLLGLSSILSNTTFQEVIPFLSGGVILSISLFCNNIGNLIIANLPIIFAISVAYSYSKKDGIAAFGAVLAFMAMHTTIGQILGITAESTADWTRYTTMLGIPTLNIGVLGGIYIGLITSWIYNKFHVQKLPMALSFFQGKRFVLIMSVIGGAIAAIPLCIVWPFLQGVISSIATAGSSGFSVWVMAGLSFLTFSLLPFGLHTFLYAAWAYQVGTYISTSGTVVHGLLNIFFAQLADGVPLTTTVPLTGNYILTGTLIGVAYAIIAEATNEKREDTKSMFMGGILTNFVTGITEPLVFPFVFAAPLLYWLAVAMMFLGELIVYFLNVTVGISFCGGLVDFIIYGVIQNASRWYLLPFISAGLGVITYFIARFMIRTFHLNVPGQEEFEMEEDEDIKIDVKGDVSLAETILSGFGGKENILELDACATRLRAEVKDASKIKKSIFTKTGASGTMKAGNNIQVIYGTQAVLLCEQIKAVMENRKIDIAVNLSYNESEFVQEEIGIVCDGQLVPLKEVNDPVFAEEMMGTGYAVKPSSDEIYSPVNGKIVNIFPTKHAIGICSDGGKEVLIHMGIDTVKCENQPFKVFVEVGQIVSVGTKIAEMNRKMIEESGYDDTVIVVFTNIPNYKVKSINYEAISHGKKGFIELEVK